MKKIFLSILMSLSLGVLLYADCSNGNSIVLNDVSKKVVGICQSEYGITLKEQKVKKVLKNFVKTVDTKCASECPLDITGLCARRYIGGVTKGLITTITANSANMKAICTNIFYK